MYELYWEHGDTHKSFTFPSMKEARQSLYTMAPTGARWHIFSVVTTHKRDKTMDAGIIRR